MKRKVRASGEPRGPRPVTTSGENSGRAAAAIRISNAVGAAFTNWRVLEAGRGALLLALTAHFAKYPRALL